MISELERGPQISIATSQSLSTAIDLGDRGLCAIIMPTSWDAANLTFQASSDIAGTYQNVYDSTGTELSVTAAAARHIVLTPASFAGMRFIKVRSGTSGTPVTQTAARTLVPLVRELA